MGAESLLMACMSLNGVFYNQINKIGKGENALYLRKKGGVRRDILSFAFYVRVGNQIYS